MDNGWTMAKRGNVVALLAMKAHRGCRRTAPPILTYALERGNWSTLRNGSLYHRARSLVPIQQDNAWAPEPVGGFGGKKKLIPVGIWTRLAQPAVCSLFWLCCEWRTVLKKELSCYTMDMSLEEFRTITSHICPPKKSTTWARTNQMTYCIRNNYCTVK